MEPKVNSTRFWLDAELVEQPAEVRYAVLWMITNPSTDWLGVFRFSPKTFAFQTGLAADWLEKALGAVATMVVREGDKVWLRNYIAYQLGRGPKMAANNAAKALAKPFGMAPAKIQEAVLREYPELNPLLRGVEALVEGCKGLPLLGPAPERPAPARGEREGVPHPQSRAEQSRAASLGEFEGAQDWTLAEIVTLGQLSGVDAKECEAFWLHYSGLGWMHGRTRITKPAHWLKKWKNRGLEFEKKNAGGKTPVVPARVKELEAALERETDPARREQLRREIRALE